tara:strand:+ start:4254 stop:5921 length:1668 start_codon:yes stop_codon:yes gene_type:complete
MAINYLNNITLNKNQLLQTAIENQINDSAVGASPVEGQIYFNTTDDVLKVYGGGTWSEVGGGVITLTLNDGTYIDVNSSGTAANPVFAPDLNAVDGTAVAATRFLSKDNTWDVPAFDNYSGWTLDGDSGTGEVISSGNTATFAGGLKITTDVASTDTLNIVHDLQSQTNSTSAASPAAGATFTVIDSVTVDTTGHIGGKNLKTITLPADTNTQETYTLPVSAGTAVTGYSVADIDLTAAGTSTGIKSKVTIAGNNDNIAITETTGNNGIVKIALTTDVVIDDTLTVGGDISQTSGGNENVFASELNMSSQKITNVLDPTSAQDAATKQYVDDATVGGLIYQGGYNATLNTPDLDSASSIAVEKGWTYTVTVAGLFFTEQVRIGDVLIAEVDQAAGASTLANWTTVQNNIDLASLTQVGIGNVVAATGDELLGINVVYSGGTGKVGLDIDGLNSITTTDDSSVLAIFDEDNSTNKKISVGNLALAGNSGTSKTGTIAAGQLSGTVTHAFGINTLVQTIDASGNTVFCDITRTATTSVATISVVEATAITILVQKIG